MEILGSLSKWQRRRISEIKLKNKVINNQVLDANYLSEKAIFEKELNRIAVSYYNFKLCHSGIVSYKGFENCNRHVKLNSLLNLKNYNQVDYYNSMGLMNFDDCLGYVSKQSIEERKFSEKQSKLCKKACSKLVYYSKKREFVSPKGKKFNMKVAFLTLTAPVSTNNSQFLKAFDSMLDYLRRTANCTYVWKKEVGSKGGKLHVHILLNNYIPYYIVDWKWKRLLIAQGVVWPKNENGVDTSSHYRIELPKNSKQTGSYISKYMAKSDVINDNVGYLWGCSKSLKDCKEIVFMEGELDNTELYNVYSKFKTVGSEYVKICLVEWNKVKTLAPGILKEFILQFLKFQEILSLPSKFCPT